MNMIKEKKYWLKVKGVSLFFCFRKSCVYVFVCFCVCVLHDESYIITHVTMYINLFFFMFAGEDWT